MSADERKVLNTLETLFSDANLQWDKVMQQHLQQQNDCVHLDTLLALPRLKAVAATKDDIIHAAKESVRLQLNSEETAVRRIKPFILHKTEELDDWSIYVEGLDKPYDTEEKITELFRDHVGHVSFIRIPNDATGKPRFHGYCFVEFDNKENVDRAVARLNRYRLDMHDAAVDQDADADSTTETADALYLRVMSKAKWNEYKDEYLAHQAECKKEIKRLWDEYNAAPLQHEEQPVQKKRRVEKDSSTEISTPADHTDNDYPKGIIARVSNLHPSSSKTTVKTLLESSGIKIAYLNYKKNTFTCHIRLNTAQDTQKIAEHFEAKKLSQKDGKDATGYQVANENESKPITVQPISGMEEEIYWQDERRKDGKKKK